MTFIIKAKFQYLHFSIFDKLIQFSKNIEKILPSESESVSKYIPKAIDA